MPIVSEHEAQVGVPDKVSSPEANQDESHVKKIKGMLQRFKLARQRYDREWHPNYEFLFGGKQWSVARPKWRFQEVPNISWASVMTEVGIQTDSRPKTDYAGVEPSDYEFAKQLESINDVNWIKYDWLQKIQDAVLDCKWVHAAHAEVYWDPELEDGLGDTALRLLDPFYCYPDPSPEASNIDQCRAFIYAGPVPTAQLKRDYPDLADRIQPDIDLIGINQGGIVATDTDQPIAQSSQNGRTLRDGNRFGGEPMTFLIRCWMKDETAYDEETTKEDGSKEYIKRLKYPKGRYTEICNNVMLCDGPNGVKVNGQIIPYRDGKFPIARLVNYSYPREYWGENEVTHLRGPQKIVNYVWSHILDQMKMAGNPKTIIGKTAGIDPDNVTNEPSVKLVVNDVNQIRFEPGTGIAPGMQYIMEQAMSILDKIQGLGDVMKGAVDPSVGSGVLFDGYVEAAQVRPRLKNRNLDQFLQQVGKLQLARYLQFYTAPRVRRITNGDGYPEYVEFYITTDGKGNQTANITKTVPTQDETGKTTYKTQPRQQIPIKGMPDVIVKAGSSLPFAKAQRTQSGMALFQAGAIDQAALLEEIDFPDREKVIERMAQAAEAAAQQQAQGETK